MGVRPLRIALIIRVAPRKLGSLEAWIIALVEEAARRGHRMDVFAVPPVHPAVSARLEAAGARWGTLTELAVDPWASILRLRREYDVIHINLLPPRGRLAKISYLAWPAKVLFWDHYSVLAGESEETSLKQRVMDRLTTLRWAGLGAISDYVLRRDVARFALREPVARRIYYGLDFDRFAPPPEGRGGPPRVLAVANLIREKGVHLLVEAFARIGLPDARLDVAGDGPELEPLRAQARALGVESRVSFLGLRDDVHLLLRQAHVFAHPCIWEEGFGLTMAEAQATGCPVVASRIGAVPEVVLDGVTGLLVPPGDVDALAAALERILRDPALRDAMGERARRHVVAKFPLADSARGHVGWCEEIADR